MKKTLALLAFMLVPPMVLAQSQAPSILILGGGGEPKGGTTIFDGNLNALGEYFKNQSWNQSAMAFNGGHSITHEIMNNKFNTAGTRTGFTEDKFNSMIDGYTTKIKEGIIASGSNLLVYVDTHGGQKEKGQLTHSISLSGAAITDTTTVKGSDVVSMDKLNDLRLMAKEKGVKLAIVDLSCHSGASQELADENTCVISSTGPKHLGYAGPGTFGDQFVSRLKSGKNLEEVFLEARQSADDNGTPMISTPEDKLMQESLYESITPYLFHANPEGDKLGSYLTKMTQENLSCHMQQREDEFKKINKLIDEIEEVNMVHKKFLFWSYKEKGIDLSAMRENIKTYKDIQDKMIKEIQKANTLELKTVEMVAFEDTQPTPITWGELFRTDYDRLITSKDNEIQNAPNDAELVRSRRWFQTLNRKKEEIGRAKPELKAAAEVAVTFDKQIASTYAQANQIKKDEKKLYELVYKNYKKQNQNTTNPCRDFVL